MIPFAGPGGPVREHLTCEWVSRRLAVELRCIPSVFSVMIWSGVASQISSLKHSTFHEEQKSRVISSLTYRSHIPLKSDGN